MNDTNKYILCRETFYTELSFQWVSYSIPFLVKSTKVKRKGRLMSEEEL